MDAETMRQKGETVSMEHKLKTETPYFNAVLDGSKTFETRENDRGFSVGDVLVLEEYEPPHTYMLTHSPGDMPFPLNTLGRYTGRSVRKAVTYILDDFRFCRAGQVTMGLKDEEKNVEAETQRVEEAQGLEEDTADDHAGRSGHAGMVSTDRLRDKPVL